MPSTPAIRSAISLAARAAADAVVSVDAGTPDIPGIAGIFDAESDFAWPACCAPDEKGTSIAARMIAMEIHFVIVISSAWKSPCSSPKTVRPGAHAVPHGRLRGGASE